MRAKGSWKGRVFAISAIALTLMVFAPELTAEVGAATTPTTAAANPYGVVVKPKVSARVLRIRRAYAAKRRAAAAKARRRKAVVTAKHNTAAKRSAARKAARLAAARKARLRASVLRTRAAAKSTHSPFSLPELGLLALSPFVLVGLGLLAADFYRRRTPRKRHASLVITRAGDR